MGIVDILMDSLKNHGPVLHPDSDIVSIQKTPNGKLTYTTKEDGDIREYADFDCILVAIGRKPVTEFLHLDKAGVKTDRRGLIEVDKFENTNVPGIYAIGDATTSGFELTPVAIA